MSEVKPTFVKEVLKDTDIPNSWKKNFSNWLWSSARSREYTWLISIFSTIFIKSYEYKLSFEKPVENFGFTFPFVVKINSSRVKDVFIYGVNYKPRSKVNYGTSFVISGSDFYFKTATRYKLEGDVFNIFKLFYTLPQFTDKSKLSILASAILGIDVNFYNANTFYPSILRISFLHPSLKSDLKIVASLVKNLGITCVFTKRVFSDFDLKVIRTLTTDFSEKSRLKFDCNVLRNTITLFANKNKIKVDFRSTLNTNAEFLTSEQINGYPYIVRLTNPQIVNRNELKVGFASNIESKFQTIGKLDCVISKKGLIESAFLNRNDLTVVISTTGCYDTTWERFGGVWITCEYWVMVKSETITAEFTNYTQITVNAINQRGIVPEYKSVNIIFVDGSVAWSVCNYTSWRRFGGKWRRCGVWKL